MLTRWQSTIVDAQGNIQPFAILTILNEETQAPAQIYASESESQPLPAGTVVADESGYAYFYARGGRYRIQSNDLNIDWRHVPLGDLQAMDSDQIAGELGLGTAATADIVGTMENGAIIERGSNENGEYVRFADGTQICFHSFSEVNRHVNTPYGALFMQSVDRTWTFPTSFSKPPTLIIGRALFHTGISWGVGRFTTSTVAYFRVLDAIARNTNEESTYELSAVGRWK